MLPTYNLLKAPQRINPEEVLHLERKVNFTFFTETHCYNLYYYDGAISFIIQYTHKLPKQLTHDQQAKFSRIEKKEKQYFIYKTDANQYYTPPLPITFPENYHIATPRVLENQIINQISLEVLVDILTTKKVIFYTGAGISSDANIHSMKELMTELGVDKSLLVDTFIRTALDTPQKAKETYEKFCRSLFSSKPTPAHYALASISLFLQTAILTENIDHLHEYAGVVALHTEDMDLKTDIDPSWFKEIDFIVCLGLSFDDRGLLGWYKQNNPNGKIIALNLEYPSYLGEEDYLVQGDLQETLLEVEKQLL